MDPEKQRVYVEGLNIVKRHQRPRRSAAPSAEAVGGVIEQEGPIHISNVMLSTPRTRSRRASASTREDGKRHRVAKRSGTKLD